jgi:hypothetical protein
MVGPDFGQPDVQDPPAGLLDDADRGVGEGAVVGDAGVVDTGSGRARLPGLPGRGCRQAQGKGQPRGVVAHGGGRRGLRWAEVDVHLGDAPAVLAGVAAGSGRALVDAPGQHAEDDVPQGGRRRHDRAVGEVVDRDVVLAGLVRVGHPGLRRGRVPRQVAQDDGVAVGIVLAAAGASLDLPVDVDGAVVLLDVDDGHQAPVGQPGRLGVPRGDVEPAAVRREGQ